MGKFSKSIETSAAKQETGKTNSQKPTVQLNDNRLENSLQRKLIEITNSRKSGEFIQRVSQEKEVQLKGMEEEEVQLKGIEEEELQLKGLEEEEVQLKGMEEEEVQLKGIEEEELQMKKVGSGPEGEMSQGFLGEPVQRVENKTGLPDQLKAGVENLSGYSLDDVKVHYNSDKPAQLNAHAYAQGTDIHLASGQEKHLPHEAWHVVQQKQGRVNPTRQLKGKVNVNDDAGLEKEADLMGEKSIQAKTKNPTGKESPVSSRVLQMVNNKSLRSQTDLRMSELKEQTLQILRILRVLGEDWEKKYGKQVKEKVKSKTSEVLDGKGLDFTPEIKKAAMEELWSQLSTEDKIEMASQAASLTGDAISSVADSGWDAFKGFFSNSEEQEESSSSSTPKKSIKQKEKQKEITKDKKQPKDDNESKSGNSSFLSELSVQDLETLYEVYKLRNKALEKLAEAKSLIIDTSGQIGEFFGEEVGKLRNEVDFDKRMKSQEQAFKVAQKRLELLRQTITDNDDLQRYSGELDALDFALNALNGPGIAYKISLNESGRSNHPNYCQQGMDKIEKSEPFITRDNEIVDIGNSIINFGKKATESKEKKEADISLAQSQMVSILEIAVDKSWWKFTTRGWTPTAIKKIRKELPRDASAKVKLEWAKGVAESAASEESSNRYPETQIFYDALAKVDLKNENSLKTATGILQQIISKLG